MRRRILQRLLAQSSPTAAVWHAGQGTLPLFAGVGLIGRVFQERVCNECYENEVDKTRRETIQKIEEMGTSSRDVLYLSCRACRI